jgi:hypothetical protein
MIIDLEPPDPPRRRWPFLLAWSLAAMTIVGVLFLTHIPAWQEAPVAVSTPPAAPASVSVSSSIGVERLLAGPSRITQYPQYLIASRVPSGSIIYLDLSGTWIAVGPNDSLLIPPDSQTTKPR